MKKVGPDSASDPHYKYLMEVTAPAVTGSVMNATAPLPSADFAMSFFTKMGQMFYLV